VAEKQLDSAEIGARFEQVYCKGMSKRMRRDRFGQTTPHARQPTGPLNRPFVHRLIGPLSWKEPGRRPGGPPPRPKLVEQRPREHDVAVSRPFTLGDMQDHSATIDIADPQSDCLTHSKARGVAGRQNHPVFGILDATEETDHFLGTQHHWQMVRAFWRRDRVEGPGLLQRDLIQESQCRDGTGHRRRRQVFVVQQVQLVEPDVLGV
jgi:hypothetical protein